MLQKGKKRKIPLDQLIRGNFLERLKLELAIRA
jgi:hypothetical protein